MKKKILSAIFAASMALGLAAVPAGAFDIDTTYDTVMLTNDGETAIANTTVNSGAPDGTNYLTATGYAEFSIGTGSSEDYVWEADICFEQDGTSFIPRNKGNYGTCITRNEGNLTIQEGGSSFRTYVEGITEDDWFHIQLVGRYGSTGQIDMTIYKYVDGERQLVGEYPNVSRRNNPGDWYRIEISPNTSVDNVQITKIGADTIELSTINDTINAGQNAVFSYTAKRGDMEVVKPAVTWEVLDSTGNSITNGDVTVTAEGLVQASRTAATQTVTVRATAQSQGNPYGEYTLNIKEVDTSNDKYDNLVLDADRDYVRVDEPLTIVPTATMNGAAVELEEGDVIWSVYNAANLLEVPNNNITIENGVLSVNESVVSQTITVRGMNPSGSVMGTYTVTVRPANALYEGEEGNKDTFITSDACEEIVEASGVTVQEGSWDGSNYYDISSTYHFAGFPSDTTEYAVYSADMKFNSEGAGWTIWNNNQGKQGLQVSYSGGSIGIVGSGDKLNPYLEVSQDKWYNVQILCRTGSEDAYAVFIVYEYDENGNRVSPLSGEPGIPFVMEDVTLRNLAEDAANHIAVNPGTSVDNVEVLKAAPDELTISVDKSAVFAGDTVQATCAAKRQGIEMPNVDTSAVQWAVCDADQLPILEDDVFSISGTGLLTIDYTAEAQDIYIRVSDISGELNAYAKVTVQSSDLFAVNTIGVNEAQDRIVSLDVTKNFGYGDDVVFIVGVYAEDGTLKGFTMREMMGSELNIGENTVPIGFDLPSDYNAETDTIKIFVWTAV